MAKRVADKYITDQNWDQEDPEEDDGRGEFRKADDDVLKSRVIRKARRRVNPGQGGPSAFSGFSGLKAPSSSNTGSPGGFKGFTLPTNGGSKAFPVAPSQRMPSFQSSSTGFKTQPPVTQEVPPPIIIRSNDDEGPHSIQEYNRHLTALNRSVSDWISDHVDRNPLCDLTPIFVDYKKYLADIDEKYGFSDSDASQSSAYVSDSQEIVLQESRSNQKARSSYNARTDSAGISSNVQKVEPPSKPLFAGFSKGATASTASPFKGFDTGSKGQPFSFNSSVATPASDSRKDIQGQEEAEYVPPKPESNIIIEDDSFFSIRCKLYFKKDDTYADKGVGQLYLKPSGDKTQLLIRADTAISQILLNILLVPSIPLKKQGKNNILIMCIPNPPINEKEKDKVTPMLIRVKTSEDADRLLELMEEKKREAEN